ncbi:hypothetical protein [Paenibacillus antarcticus]|uniref:hypothetical protein n=1 Tax=Paenibacillus antarcticus TaxID=253703 RepID=UPI000A86E9D7|nr:hypothetical protein [Paenibacillus antarcticus]
MQSKKRLMISISFGLTQKYGAVGEYVKIPDNINRFNSPMSSSPVEYQTMK